MARMGSDCGRREASAGRGETGHWALTHGPTKHQPRPCEPLVLSAGLGSEHRQPRWLLSHSWVLVPIGQGAAHLRVPSKSQRQRNGHISQELPLIEHQKRLTKAVFKAHLTSYGACSVLRTFMNSALPLLGL